MNGLIPFSVARLPVSPWRNGGGETREIVSWPAGTPDFDWRASIATLAQDGPFSAFAGIDRSITLLNGAGVHLSGPPDIDHFLTVPGEPFTFSGDRALYARLCDGETTDFNLMTRRSVCVSTVITTCHSLDISRQDGGVMYAVRGEWRFSDGPVMQEGDGYYWADPAPEHAGGQRYAMVPVNPNNSLLLWASVTRV